MTTRRLARNIGVDVSADGGTTWLNLPGRVDNAPAITPNKVDSTDVDTNGFTSSEITLQSGVLTIKYNSIAVSGTPNPAQELVEACVAQFGDAARLTVRYYDKDGGSRGYSGLSIVEVAYSSTNVPDLRQVTVTFTFDGTITKLTQTQINTIVAGLSASVPTIVSALPSGVAVGGIVRILGQGFLGTVSTTGVKFGGVNATSWIVESDTAIVAVMPAGSAGSAPVIVTNATGASAAFPYTRGA